MEKMRRCGVLHGAYEQCGVEGVELVPVFPSQIYIYIYIYALRPTCTLVGPTPTLCIEQIPYKKLKGKGMSASERETTSSDFMGITNQNV